jgi:hypothetical protein
MLLEYPKRLDEFSEGTIQSDDLTLLAGEMGRIRFIHFSLGSD